MCHDAVSPDRSLAICYDFTMADPVTTPPRAAGKGASDSERARAQAEAWRLPFAPLDSPPDEPGLWSEVPLELLVRFSCVPLRHEGARLVVAFGGLAGITRVDEPEVLLRAPVTPV